MLSDTEISGGSGERNRAASAERERVDLKRKVLLAVPHQDDELFVGGGFFKTLVQGERYEAYVLFTTNGDFFAHEAKVRLEESLCVLTELYGIAESHIFFLGYGDGWRECAHLYHQEGEEPYVSEAGRTETYGLEGHEDYRWSRSGRHSAYRRADLKRDIKDVLEEVRADILLVVDFDKHPDHRAASMLVEECLGELFREDLSYRPLLLKRFAYDGVWKGKADFFDVPAKETVLAELSQSPYTETDMLRFAMPDDCVTPCLSSNFLYKAFRHYKTQEVWQKADEIINTDEVYFKRNTGNLLFGATITASSGNPEYLRDFKLFDCGNVLQRELVLKECGWKPEERDKEKRVRIHFDNPVAVGRIAVYARGICGTDKLTAGICFDKGTAISGMEICPDGKKNLFVFVPRTGVRDMEFRIEKWEGVFWGITELEILPPEEEELPKELQNLLVHGQKERTCPVGEIRKKAEKAVFSLQKRFFRWMPNRYVLRRRYPELVQREKVPFGYRCKYIVWRIRQRQV